MDYKSEGTDGVQTRTKSYAPRWLTRQKELTVKNPTPPQQAASDVSRLQGEVSEYVRSREAARLIGVAEGTLSQWRHHGKRGPAYFIPPGTRTVLYSVTEVRNWIEAGRVETTGGANNAISGRVA